MITFLLSDVQEFFLNSDTNDSYVLCGGGVVTHPPLLQNEALLN